MRSKRDRVDKELQQNAYHSGPSYIEVSSSTLVLWLSPFSRREHGQPNRRNMGFRIKLSYVKILVLPFFLLLCSWMSCFIALSFSLTSNKTERKILLPSLHCYKEEMTVRVEHSLPQTLGAHDEHSSCLHTA